MNTLSELYTLVEHLTTVRRMIVGYYFTGAVQPQLIRLLRDALDNIRRSPGNGSDYLLQVDESGATISTGLTYEIDELEKDIAFLESGDDALHEVMERKRPGCTGEASSLADELSRRLDAYGEELRLFLTDRDGTVNNYCARYRSSAQSVYNAVYLSRLARRRSRRSVILSSGPLHDGGLLDLSVNLEHTFVYAGSKGREYCDEGGRRGSLPISTEQARILDRLNDRIARLVEEPENRKYALIGSALQYKFGQTTIARQDIEASVNPEESERFLGEVSEVVRSIDPAGENLKIEDTGLDIEIALTVQETGPTGAARDFDKGAGLEFLDRELELGVGSGPLLICGDTASDLSMVERALRRTERVTALFVTTDENLRSRVLELAPDALFARSPDALVTALNDTALS
ncbi:hypothetical protein [Salinispira pacifica]